MLTLKNKTAELISAAVASSFGEGLITADEICKALAKFKLCVGARGAPLPPTMTSSDLKS